MSPKKRPLPRRRVPSIPAHVATMAATVTFGLIPLFHYIAIGVRLGSRAGNSKVARDQDAEANLARYWAPVPGCLRMFACYAAGFACYVRRWPQRWAPGRFDFLFHSHQWWHLFVLLAAVLWQDTMELFLSDPYRCPAAS